MYPQSIIQGEKTMKLKPIVVVMPVMFALLTGCNTMNSSSNQSQFPWLFVPYHHHHHKHAAGTPGNIIENCIKLDEAEIKAANLAKMKSTCPMVRRFAANMVRDHHQNLRNVRRLSHEIGVAPTMNSDAMHIEETSAHKYAELKMLSGYAFNKEFIDSMIHCHHKALAMLDRAINDSTNPKLTAYLKSTHAAVTKHLHEAEALQKKCTSK